MNSPETPDDPETNFTGDWYQRMEAARKTHGREWHTQFTPEELRFIEEAIDAECKWISHANEYDLPGPRRFGVIDD